MKFKKIDFEKIKQDSIPIKNVYLELEKSFASKHFWKGIIGFPIVFTIFSLFMGSRWNGDLFFAVILFTFANTIVLSLLYNKFVGNRYMRLFPKNTPEEILKNMDKYCADDVELILYKNKLPLFNGDTVDGSNFEVIGPITSEIDLQDFYQQAYDLKADAIISFRSNIVTSSHIKNAIFSNNIKTDVEKEERHSGIAVKIIDNVINESEKKATSSENKLTDELDKLFKLHQQGALSDEEFKNAKQKILS